jgi:tetratricopeptide (TPR) repeat protein
MKGSKMDHISYEQLLEIVDRAIFTMKIKRGCLVDVRLSEISPIEGAHKGGIYLGSPGADIFYSLPYLTEHQIDELAIKFSETIPFELPPAHDNMSACFRLIYGRLVKHGIMLSKSAIDDVKKEIDHWEYPRKFLKKVHDNLKKSNNNYGLAVLCSMSAHRLGDEAVISHDIELLYLMGKKYEEAVCYAKKCNSKVHVFTSYYWGAKYYDKYGDKARAVEWYSMMIENFNKKGAKRKGVYTGKLVDAANRIRKLDIAKFKSIYDFYITRNNLKGNRKPLRKALRKVNCKVK